MKLTKESYIVLSIFVSGFVWFSKNVRLLMIKGCFELLGDIFQTLITMIIYSSACLL